MSINCNIDDEGIGSPSSKILARGILELEVVKKYNVFLNV